MNAFFWSGNNIRIFSLFVHLLVRAFFFFVLGFVPDEYLPKEIFEAEGGAKRRRSSMSLRETVGLREASVGRVHPQAGEGMKIEEEL